MLRYVLQLNEVADKYLETLIRRTMDNLNDKISNEAQNQPSCLGAVSRCSVTQEQIDNRTSDYVCWDCGRQFLTDEQKKRESVVTAHKSICGLCNEEKYVTSIRHWNWLRLNIG